MRNRTVPIALGVLLVVEILVAAAGHESKADLERTLDTGDSRERVSALFRLTNRGEPIEVDAPFIRNLYASDDDLVREWTMTSNFVRLSDPAPQRAFIARRGNSPAAVRARFFFDYRVGSYEWITRESLDRYLEAVEEE